MSALFMPMMPLAMLFVIMAANNRDATVPEMVTVVILTIVLCTVEIVSAIREKKP